MAALRGGLQVLCRDFPQLMEAEVVPGFEANYDRWFDSAGWVDDAYVNYFAEHPEKTYAEETELLTESVHMFSSRPILAFNFGRQPTPASWTAERFPQLVAFRVREPLPHGNFNFNKLRAMLLGQVRTGIVVDSDTVVFSRSDVLFPRTREEVTKDYPYPIMPVHWMSRESFFDDSPYRVHLFKCPGCPQATMRWGHAHPTWTYHALPFLGQLLAGAVLPRRRCLELSEEVSEPLGEDEDMFNVGLWARGAWKQWCKWDVPVTQTWIGKEEERTWPTPAFTEDPKWFPHGIPYAFYQGHGATHTNETLTWIRSGKPCTKCWYYKDRLYDSMEEMQEAFGYKDGPAGRTPKCRL